MKAELDCLLSTVMFLFPSEDTEVKVIPRLKKLKKKKNLLVIFSLILSPTTHLLLAHHLLNEIMLRPDLF